jgi:hypothetical protein
VRKEVAGCVLVVWVAVDGFLVTACDQSGAVKQVVSSAATKSTTAVTHSPAPAASPAPARAVASSAPAGAAVTPAPATTAAPAKSPATSGWLWLWIALAVLIVAILTAWFIRLRHRRAAIAADWRTRLINAYAKGSALYDAMAVAEVPEVFGAADANTRWTDIQRRADDFGQLLYSLRESAHDEQERAAITSVLASLGPVLSAMAAERSVRGTNDLMVGVVRDRLSTFAMSLRSLRGPRARPSPMTDEPSGTGDTDPLGWPES